MEEAQERNKVKSFKSLINCALHNNKIHRGSLDCLYIWDCLPVALLCLVSAFRYKAVFSTLIIIQDIVTW
jgi:hypothetical protein